VSFQTANEKGSVSLHLGSGGVCQLPDIPDLGWEQNAKGGFEAWHAPNNTRKRTEKTYLSYVNLRTLDNWAGLTESQRIQTITAWVNQKRAEKGIQVPESLEGLDGNKN